MAQYFQMFPNRNSQNGQDENKKGAIQRPNYIMVFLCLFFRFSGVNANSLFLLGKCMHSALSRRICSICSLLVPHINLLRTPTPHRRSRPPPSSPHTPSSHPVTLTLTLILIFGSSEGRVSGGKLEGSIFIARTPAALVPATW